MPGGGVGESSGVGGPRVARIGLFFFFFAHHDERHCNLRLALTSVGRSHLNLCSSGAYLRCLFSKTDPITSLHFIPGSYTTIPGSYTVTGCHTLTLTVRRRGYTRGIIHYLRPRYHAMVRHAVVINSNSYSSKLTAGSGDFRRPEQSRSDDIRPDYTEPDQTEPDRTRPDQTANYCVC